jgi:hypothetical protein
MKLPEALSIGVLAVSFFTSVAQAQTTAPSCNDSDAAVTASDAGPTLDAGSALSCADGSAPSTPPPVTVPPASDASVPSIPGQTMGTLPGLIASPQPEMDPSYTTREDDNRGTQAPVPRPAPRVAPSQGCTCRLAASHSPSGATFFVPAFALLLIARRRIRSSAIV